MNTEAATNEGQTALWVGVPAGLGGFLSAVLPSAWPWYLQIAIVIAAGAGVYGIAKRYSNREGA